MSVIGVFVPSKDGGWTGTIRTLTVEVRARLVPNDNRASEGAPAFRIYAGRSELGAAWQARTTGENPREYHRVQLDDPCLPESISAALFVEEGGQEARLVWNRKRDAG